MATPAFGFSVGDFIAGIKLVKDLIDSLDEAAGAGPDYRRLAAELRSLERALTEVKNLRIPQSQAAQKVALEQAATQCQDCIEIFLCANTKFKNTLGALATKSKWRTNLRKFQWVVCKTDAVNKFRAEITGHALTINTLMATMQLTSITMQVEMAEEQHDATKQHHQECIETRSIARDNNNLLHTQAGLVLAISKMIANPATQQTTQDLQTIMLKVVETNMKIYQIVLDMQSGIQNQLPSQINRQQPVYFEDAHGRLAPFHIEFINSLEAFQAVMEVRFRHVPGLKKFQRNEYLLQDPGSKRKLNLQAPWESIFRPGRRVVMSMTFQAPRISTSSCPGCQTEDTEAQNSFQNEVKCSNTDCGMLYQRVLQVGFGDEPVPETARPTHMQAKRRRGDDLGPRAKRARLSYDNFASGIVDDNDDSDDDTSINDFTRVNIIHKRKRLLREKYSTAVTLAKIVLEYHNKPLEPSLRHVPYLSTIFPKRRRRTSILSKVARNETVFALGVALIELSYAQRLKSLERTEDLDENGNRADLTEFYTAHRLHDDLMSEEVHLYTEVVRRCLRCEFDTVSSSLDDAEFRKKFYDLAVVPLQQITWQAGWDGSV